MMLITKMGKSDTDKQKERSSKGPILFVHTHGRRTEYYSKLLRNAGYKLDIARDGRTALKMLAKKKHGLVLLDLLLAALDGIEVIKTVRGNKEKYGAPILVAFTNITMKILVREMFDAGVDQYWVISDTSDEELIRKLDEVLADK